MHPYVYFIVGFIASSITLSEACSCMTLHPQEQYCMSDFVILARIKREISSSDDTRAFKVRIRKEFKMSEKAREALKSGRLLTMAYDSLCGVNYQIGKSYVISGKVQSLKAWVKLCDMNVLWHKFTRRQRKGLRMAYGRGCNCKIHKCYGRKCHKTKTACPWVNWDPYWSDCFSEYGICLSNSRGICKWTKSKELIECNKNRYNITSIREY